MRDRFLGTFVLPISSSYRSYGRGGGYSMLDADGSDRPAALRAIVRPYPQRIAGIPLGIGYDESAGSFLFRYQPDPGSQAATELFIPERNFPAGYKVDCTGCTYEKDGTTLRLSAESGVSEVTVRVGR